jgi:hypothetical protein
MSPAPYPPTRRRHKEVLFYSLLALIAAPLLEVHPNERVGLRGNPDLLLPPTCLSRSLFGVNCPACGLTRSFVHLERGDWIASTQCHRLGWLLMLVAAIQVPYRVAILLGAKRVLLRERLGRWIGRILIALLIGNWILGVVFRWD